MIPSLEKATALKSALLFSDLQADELLALAALCEEVEIAPGARVFTEHEPGDALYVVVTGRVAVERGDRMLAEIGEGDCFGELALLDDGPRSATVTAVERTELLRIVRDDFLDMLTLYPGVGRAVLEILARRLRETHAVAP